MGNLTRGHEWRKLAGGEVTTVRRCSMGIAGKGSGKSLVTPCGWASMVEGGAAGDSRFMVQKGGGLEMEWGRNAAGVSRAFYRSGEGNGSPVGSPAFNGSCGR